MDGDGENNGKLYFLMDDLGGKPTIFGNIHMDIVVNVFTNNTWEVFTGFYPTSDCQPLQLSLTDFFFCLG